MRSATPPGFRQPAPAFPTRRHRPRHRPDCPAPATHAGHVIPDAQLPFDRLRDVNADIQIAVAALTTGGETWHDVAGHLLLRDGKLQLSPFKAALPAGPLDLAVTADATRTPPPVTLRLRAPSLALARVLALIGRPGVAKGTLDLSADLHGTGDSPHALAASLNGTLVASMSGGEIDNRVLKSMLGPVIARGNPIGLLERGSSGEIRCFAARLTAHDGMATLNPFLLNTSLITVDGSGGLNLGAETLDLHLRPQGRIGGTAFSVPLTVSGGFAQPRVAMNETGAAGEIRGGDRGAGRSGRRAGTGCSVLRVRAGADARRAAPSAPAPVARATATPKPKLRNPARCCASYFVELVKRFWDSTAIEPVAAGFGILLDRRPVRLPGGAALVVGPERLARAIAAEWQAAGPDLSFADTPLTRLAGTAQERIAGDPWPTIDAIARYGESDLLCYRAEAPEALMRRQAENWQPWLDWAARALDAPLRVTVGVAPIRQHRGAIAALRKAVAGFDAYCLAGLGLAVPALGSLVLGLALAEGLLEPAAAFSLGALDELFQAELWGQDNEAVARRTGIVAEIALAAHFIRLTRNEERS